MIQTGSRPAAIERVPMGVSTEELTANRAGVLGANRDSWATSVGDRIEPGQVGAGAFNLLEKCHRRHAIGRRLLSGCTGIREPDSRSRPRRRWDSPVCPA